MIHKLSGRIASFFMGNGTNEEDAEVLSYGAECLINFLISIFLLLLIGYIANQFWGVIIWSCSYSLLRTHLGGWHASTNLKCILLGSIADVFSIWISPLWLREEAIAIAALILCAGIVLLIAPVPHKHKPVKPQDRPKLKGKAVVIFLLEAVVAGFVLRFFPHFASFMITGIVMSTMMGVLGWFFNPR